MPDQRRIRTRHCCCGVAALSPCRRVVVAFLLLLALSSCWVVTAASTSAGPRTSTSSSSHLQRLFNALDSDTDGQLRKHELRQYIHTQHLSTPGHLDGAVDGVIDALDSPDVGLGVSPLELEQHLHTLLEGVQVADWVAPGLGLPQYADAFRANSITTLDLPMLINDGGKLLQTELQVASPLHRQKLLRAMQRQILGLGAPPGPLQHLHCSSSGHAQATPTPPAAAAAGAGAVSGVVCSWQPPADPGQPVMHKYLLQRVEHSAAFAAAAAGAAGAASAVGLRWQTVAELSHDSLSTKVLDVPHRPGVYQYRLAAWNLYGHSPYVLSGDETVTEQQLTQQQQQQQPLPVAAATAAAADSVSLVPSMPAPLQAATQGAQQWHQWPDSCSAQHLQQSADALVVQQQPQDAVMWGPSSSCSSTTSSSSSSSALGPASQGSQSWPDLQQPQQQQLHQQPGNSVVWVVGLDAEQALQQGSTQPAPAAGRAAQRELAASLGAAAAAAAAARGADRADGGGPAGLIALLGSAWHTNIGSWVKAVLNSLTAFVLLVLPVCVRLLPVPVLTQAAHVLAWLLHFLPGQARQRLLLQPEPLQQQQQQPTMPAASSLLAGDKGHAVAVNPAAAQGPAAAAAAATGLAAAGAGGDAVSNGCADAGGQMAAAAAPQDPQQLAALRQRQLRLFFPRSVSEFDLLRGQQGVPAAAAAAAAASASTSSSRSPYRHSSPVTAAPPAAAAGITQPRGGSPVISAAAAAPGGHQLPGVMGGLWFASTAGVAGLLLPGSGSSSNSAAAGYHRPVSEGAASQTARPDRRPFVRTRAVRDAVQIRDAAASDLQQIVSADPLNTDAIIAAQALL